MTTKRIIRSQTKRSDDMAEGNLVKIADPKFVSLVGLPANQRPFQVIRSQKPVKRGESAVLMMEMPEDYDEEDTKEAMKMFGMDGTYTVVENGGKYSIVRSDLQSIAKVQALKPVEFRLTKDITIHLDPKQYQPKAVERAAGVVVVGIEFDKQTFDNEKIISWGHQNSVDISDVDIENSTSAIFSVSRMEIPAGVEVRKMELEAGLTAQVVREADVEYENGWPTIPDGYVAAVNEAAYGQWGWGQVDFAASMADMAFCEMMEDANYRLRNVLSNILFYSMLPLDVRKQLVTRCLEQYEAFVHYVIDQLPSQVLLLASRADSIKRKESDMAIDKEKAEKELAEIEAKRAAEEQAKKEAEAKAATEAEAQRAADEAAAAAAQTAAPAAGAADEQVTVTRAELTQMIADGVKAAMEADAKRAADEKAAADKADADKAAAEAAATAQRSDASSLSKEDIASIVAAAVQPLTEKIERMENTAVVRSEAADVAGTKKEPAKRSVFGGLFGAVAQSTPSE